MDSPNENKKIHFSIDTFTKKCKFCNLIEKDNTTRFKPARSYSSKINSKFVPTLRPKKSLLNPSHFMLNEDDETQEKSGTIGSKSVKDILCNENNSMSFSSISNSYSSIEEKNISNKCKDVDELDSNDNKIKSILKNKKDKSPRSSSGQNLLISIPNMRKKLQMIKNNAYQIYNKECIDLNLFNLKKKFF